MSKSTTNVKGIRTISRTTAWREGSKIWILPAVKSSHWTKKVDWLLNFQITKASRFKSKDINPEFVKTLSSLGLELDWKEETLSPVNMILTMGKLPCDAVVILPDGLTKKGVLKHTLKLLEDFKRPTVRMFPMDTKSERWPELNDLKEDLPQELSELLEFVDQQL
jgi:hypothetical protein